MREGCYNCHSQMIRPFRAETLRYGHYSVAGEFVYDHPFQWGSKRTGPDLHARRRHVQRRVAPHAPEQSARRGARVEHAGLPVAGADAGRRRRHRRRSMQRAAHGRRALQRRARSPRRRRACTGKTELDALVAYLQVLGTALKQR